VARYECSRFPMVSGGLRRSIACGAGRKPGEEFGEVAVPYSATPAKPRESVVLAGALAFAPGLRPHALHSGVMVTVFARFSYRLRSLSRTADPDRLRRGR